MQPKSTASYTWHVFTSEQPVFSVSSVTLLHHITVELYFPHIVYVHIFTLRGRGQRLQLTIIVFILLFPQVWTVPPPPFAGHYWNRTKLIFAGADTSFNSLCVRAHGCLSILALFHKYQSVSVASSVSHQHRLEETPGCILLWVLFIIWDTSFILQIL